MTQTQLSTDVVVVGAGGCGLTAALVAAEQGQQVLLFERDGRPGGSTSMSAGIFVAAGSKLQHLNGESGSPQELASDIFRLNGHQSDAAVTDALCQESGALMDWLVAQGAPMEHMADYRYPGMSHSWIHSPPQRDGAVIVDALHRNIDRQSAIDLFLETRVTGLTMSEGKVTGIIAHTHTGARLNVRAPKVILASSGFGANSALVAQHIPHFAGAPYFGGRYATGDALRWGIDFGAAVDHMSAYQSHSSIAYPEKMLVTTYLINHGAIQVNRDGQRFGNETDSYAGHALAALAQPDRIVVEIFDGRIRAETVANYPRFASVEEAGIVMRGQTLAELAGQFELNAAALTKSVAAYNKAINEGKDEFGRTKFGAPLEAPFYAIRVTSALVQTLGGLCVDEKARVLDADGKEIHGLYAGGGAAAGLAGPHPEGYLAGAGLLAAFGLGHIAGRQTTLS